MFAKIFANRLFDHHKFGKNTLGMSLSPTFGPMLRAGSLVALLFLVGCSKSFVVTSDVPRPLIEKLPITAKLVYSDEFRNYVYVEPSQKRALERVDFGNAQVGMFDQVFGSLFSLAEPDATQYDLKIEPQILEFQYSIPAETKLKLFEIWVKYRLQITDPNDVEIADWVVKGYGKTPTSMLASQLSAFNSASNVALRDVGAQLALGFATQPSIEDYFAGKRANKSAALGAEPAAPLAELTQESADAESAPTGDLE